MNAETSALPLMVNNLRVSFLTDRGPPVRAVDGVSFCVRRGETVAIVGESGSGKTATCMSIMRLIASSSSIQEGQVVFEGQDLALLSQSELQKVRGNRLSMVFQDSQTALDPIMRVGDQICEVLLRHKHLSRRDARGRSESLLARVGIHDPGRRMSQYPHELSGGMRQRVMIAMALACEPSLVIADEPTTALDVSVQAQILDLFAALKESSQAAFIVVTHDLGVVAEVADTVLVMYAGQVAEMAPVVELFDDPLHPYTVGLLACISDPASGGPKQRLTAIQGAVPDLARLPPGCAFRNRCPRAFSKCSEPPPIVSLNENRQVRCWLHVE